MTAGEALERAELSHNSDQTGADEDNRTKGILGIPKGQETRFVVCTVDDPLYDETYGFMSEALGENDISILARSGEAAVYLTRRADQFDETVSVLSAIAMKRSAGIIKGRAVSMAEVDEKLMAQVHDFERPHAGEVDEFEYPISPLDGTSRLELAIWLGQHHGVVFTAEEVTAAA